MPGISGILEMIENTSLYRSSHLSRASILNEIVLRREKCFTKRLNSIERGIQYFLTHFVILD